ncbi:MAG TPA: molybdopterin-dependent oxidoreductase [Syntrophomonadaceae bacterium]|nr:molybdopterin-dependent oxidoreductase [Syntrophomonadaceae bacterium]
MNNAHSGTTVNTVCTVCEANCGMIVHLQDGNIVNTEGNPAHPISQGYLCPKGLALPEMLKASGRIRHPMKRNKDNSWQEICWAEALDDIAENLSSLQKKGCPHHLAVHIGQAGVNKQFTDYAARFCSIYGTPNLSTAGSYCHTSRLMANTLTFGYRPVPDYGNSHCIVLWGYNPTHSSPPIANAIIEARHRGAGLIVIDPYSSPLAGSADLHLQVRPGTDMILALGLLNYIVVHGLYDQEFQDGWTIGFDRLIEALQPYTPEQVEKITWVPAGKLAEAARLYATSPSACLEHGMALELQNNGFQTIRYIAILQAITGNLDIPGGALFVPSFELDSLTLTFQGEPVEAIGQSQFPLFHEFTRQSQANVYSNAIIEGKPYPIESMIVVGSNPLLAWPNAKKVRQALESLDFLVIIDNFMTASAQLADLVLPAATFLSQNELWQAFTPSGECVIGLAPKIFEEDDCLSDWEVWNRLAKKMKYDVYFPWKDDEDALNDRLHSLGLSLGILKDSPHGYVYAIRQNRKYLKDGFATNSGKVEIYSSMMDQFGYDPLPGFQDAIHDVLISQTPGAYPLTLSFGTRSIGYRQSKSSNTKGGKRRSQEPCLEIHPTTAREMGISEGKKIIVESLLGSIVIKNVFNDEINPGVVFIPHGWDQANANILIGHDNLDPVTGFPVDRSVNVNIYMHESHD